MSKYFIKSYKIFALPVLLSSVAQALNLFRFCRRFSTVRMVKRCVVYGCGNSCKGENTVNEFPKNPTIRRQWISFVRVKRANFATPPMNMQTVINKAHFYDKCYSTEVLRKAELSGSRVKKRKTLVPGRIPTIYPEQCAPKRPSPEDSEASTSVERLCSFHVPMNYA